MLPNDKRRTLKIELLSQWKLEAESRNTDSEIMHAEAGFNIQGPEAGIHSARWALLRPFVAEASVPTDNQPLPLHDEADHHGVLGREQPISFSLPGVYHFAVDLQVVPPPLCVMSFGS